MKKKLLTVILAIFSACLICVSGSFGVFSVGASNDDYTVQFDELDATTTGTISILKPSNELENNIIDAAIAGFKGQYPNVNVEQVAVDISKYDEQVIRLNSIDALPDIIWCNSSKMYTLISNQIALDLDGLMEDATDAGIFDKDTDFTVEFNNMGNYNGVRYAIPRTADSVVTFYNKEIMAAAGVDVNQYHDGWTWDQFLSVCETLRQHYDDQGKPSYYPVQPNLYWEAVAYPIVKSLGGEIVDSNGNWEGVLTQAKAGEIYDFVHNLVSKNYIPDIGAGEFTSNSFEAGDCPMLFQSASVATFQSYFSLKDKFDIVPFPLINGEDSAIGSGFAGYTLNKKVVEDQNKLNIAGAFLAYMMSYDGQQKMAKDGGMTTPSIRTDLGIDNPDAEWHKNYSNNFNMSAYTWGPEYKVEIEYGDYVLPGKVEEVTGVLCNYVGDYCVRQTKSQAYNSYNSDLQLIASDGNFSSVHTVTFDANGGEFSGSTTQQITYGGKVVEPIHPTKTGCVFDGWYSNSQCTIPFDFTASITKDTVIYAKWKEKVQKPVADDTIFTYNGQEQTYNVAESPAYTVEGNKQTSVGQYIVTVKLNDGYVWADGTTSDITFDFEIEKCKVQKPVGDDTIFTYNGQEQTYNVAESPAYTVEGNKQTSVGQYTVTVKLNDGYVWADGATGDITFDFEIEKCKVQKPVADDTEFVYNGNLQIYNIPASDLYSVTNNVQVGVGEYVVAVELTDKDNYKWADGTTDVIYFIFNIAKCRVQKPVADDTIFTYNGQEQTYNVAESTAYTVEGNKQTSVGQYTVIVKLNDGYAWADGTTSDITFDFEIENCKGEVQKPVADDTEFIYNEQNQIYNIPASDKYTVSNNVQKYAGEYTVTVRLNDKNNYEWADGTTDDLTFSFIIRKAKIRKPIPNGSECIYNGQMQSYNILASNKYTVSNNVQINAGSYVVTVSINDKNNYEWEDGTTTDIYFTFIIRKAKVVKPIVDDTVFIYNGQMQSYNIPASDKYTVSNNVQINAGSYVVKVSLNNPSNYEWEDGTTNDLNFIFTIKAQNESAEQGCSGSIEGVLIPSLVAVLGAAVIVSKKKRK